MKFLQTRSVIILVGIFVGACGAQATPTTDPVKLQNTAAAAASTLIAETQAAILTSTPIPPTKTPTPTDTPVPLPTTSPTAIPTNTTSTDECNKPISGFSGPETTILVVNNTGQPIGVWFQVGKTAFGECGYASIPPLKPGDSYSFSAPQGCYAAGAWTTGERKFTIDNVRYPLCVNNTDKWTLIIKRDIIYLNPP
jgi:hypothetical protein